MSKRFLVSGYYGFDNFGDDAILKCIVDFIKLNYVNSTIDILSSNPTKTKSVYNSESHNRFNFRQVLTSVKSCDVLISGGGSLLQDTTSLKSLIYYLLIIFLASIYRKKIVIFAQGIGPIKTLIGKILTQQALKLASVISVRDELSSQLLTKWNIEHKLTADPVWGFNIERITSQDFKTVGLQVREWNSLTEDKIEYLANSVASVFGNKGCKFVILNLQKNLDTEVSNVLVEKLKSLNIESEIIDYDDINQCVEAISNFDYFIAMRFHASLVAIKAGIPTLLLSYDPKVTSLAIESQSPYVDIITMNQPELIKNLHLLLGSSDNLSKKLSAFSSEKADCAKKNIDLLLNL